MAAIGIDIGGTNAKLGLVDGAGRIVLRTQVPTGAELPAPEMVGQLAAAVRELGGGDTLRGLGVAVPGCRREDGEGVVNVTNLPHLDGYPLRAELERATGLRTALDNDANAAALGEYRYGAGDRTERLLVVTVGTGIGAGMIVDGAVHRVSWQGLGDPGHVVILPGGPRCACGGRGCAEAVAAVPAILRGAATRSGADVESLAPLDVAGAARTGEAFARDAIAEAGGYLGVALATLSHLLGPTRILLGGGGIDVFEELLLDPARAAFEEHVQAFFRRVTLGRARLGNDAGILGAAALVGPSDDAQ